MVIMEGQQKALASLKDISGVFVKRKLLIEQIENIRKNMKDLRDNYKARSLQNPDSEDEGFIGYFVFKKEEANTSNLLFKRKSDGKIFYPDYYEVYEVNSLETEKFRDEYERMFKELINKRTELSQMERELKDADEFLTFADKAGRVAETFNKLKEK